MSPRFDPAGPLRGSLIPPPDKSISHRAALVGAMSDEPVTIRNFLRSEDTLSTIGAIRSLGAGVAEEDDDVVVRGVGLRTAQAGTGGLVDVGNAGTLLRILPGWLAGQPGGEWTLDGDESIRARPVDRVVDPLRAMGADVESRDGRPPLTVRGAQLTGAYHELGVASAQVKSCLLFAGMLAQGQTTIREPHQSRDHTERILRRSRVPFEWEEGALRVREVDELELEDIEVPGDASSAAFIVAAALLVPRSRVVIRGVGVNWTRTGFLRIVRRMGAVVIGDLEPPPADDPDRESGAPPAEEPVGELDVAAAPLEGTVVAGPEVPLAIDELPLVALLGCFADGETVVRGAAELRYKESDRIAGVVEGLRGLGADIEGTEDGFAVRGGGLDGGRLEARGDHRLAMLGAIAGLASRKGVEVAGMDAAAVSYPSFVRDLEALAAGG
ncbi:MAG TPA: 3-phosphoshikimate 1-carboxyvinyltransferase [Thermoleophilaceae bacterium]|nr:3-phosphoshikimate 1-carboxyvinyltransferase [Thermoleophilaceae bacterium]